VIFNLRLRAESVIRPLEAFETGSDVSLDPDFAPVVDGNLSIAIKELFEIIDLVGNPAFGVGQLGVELNL
jgi:hypothetical protein